jgi:hypothetical protein
MRNDITCNRTGRHRLFARADRPREAAGWPRCLPAALMCLAVAASGCTRFDLSKNIPWGSHDSKPQVPTRITAVWTDTVLHQPKQPAIRGFGGRLMFYVGKGEDPVRVDGALTVYAYDDTDKSALDSESGTPTRKYVFPGQYLSKHYSKSSLGHSYSFWLPWDKLGGPQRDVSLIARFETTAGHVATSPVAHQLLPGSTPAPQGMAKKDAPLAGAREEGQAGVAEAATEESGERQVAHTEPVETLPTRASFETSTITVPAGFLSGSSGHSRNAGSLSHAAPSQTLWQQPGGRSATSLPRGHATAAAPGTETATGLEADAALQGQAPPPSGLSARFAPVQLPAPSPPRARPRRRLVRTRPHPGGWPSRLPSTPRPDHTALGREYAPTGLPSVAEPAQVLDR